MESERRVYDLLGIYREKKDQGLDSLQNKCEDFDPVPRN